MAPVLTFSTCIGPMNMVFLRTCNAVTPADVKLTGPTVAGVTPGTMTGIDCTTTIPALGCTAKITGSLPVRYTNPAGAVHGKLTALVAGQSLVVSGSTCPASWAPNGPADYGAPAGGPAGLADLTYTLSTAGPTIT